MTDEPIARLLIIDDEGAQARALCQTLEAEGYHTTGFTSALQAMEALRTQSFDLLLTDLMMPEMDGITLLRTSLEIDPNLVGIVMTGYGTIDTAVEAIKGGALDYILKPFKLSTILPVLSRALQVRSLRIANQELALRISERTRELEIANQELEAFSYSISHDLRNPLSVVLGYSQILIETHTGRMDENALRMLGYISETATRMERLIADLLRLATLGRQPLSKKPVRTRELVQQVLTDLRAADPQRQADIRITELPDCFADPSLLRQVFINLLGNALKFTRKREQALIEIGCRQETEAQLYFVRDNGAGFDPNSAAILFGAFQRLHSAQEFEGTGVGLSIVKRIVSRHGGRIWAESEVNRGATFYFTLPSAAEGNQAEAMSSMRA